jgi:RNA-binding protein
MPAPQLTGRQRKALRALAHNLEPVVQVGQGGISAGVVQAIEAALLAHELIKVRLHQPVDKKASAQELAHTVGAVLCGLVGHTVILYRPHPETPRIRLSGEG